MTRGVTTRRVRGAARVVDNHHDDDDDDDRGATARGFAPPAAVRQRATLGLQLRANGFGGGTATGWNRARQLRTVTAVPLHDLATMRAWFARHGPDASNGGTSYVGYRQWIADGRPTTPRTPADANRYRGAVAWLLWGGDPAYRWLKSDGVRAALRRAFPKRKEASRSILLARS